jgi:HTH-type transcriptional regulator / antitoxin HigA
MENNWLDRIEIRPLTDEAAYQHACDLVEQLMEMEEQALSDTNQAKRLAYLDTLATLVEAYEAKHFAFNQTELTLTQIIEQALEQLNLTKKDLAKMLGSNRVSELFSGKRDLSMAQVRILHQQLRIPTNLLVLSKRAGSAA